jgi:hypothetical protein
MREQHSINHAANSHDITISKNNAPSSNLKKTRRRKRHQQEAAESHGPKPLTKLIAEEVSQVDTSWLKDEAPSNIRACERKCRTSSGAVLFQIIMTRTVMMIL